eukprot:11996472-Alexandrium_andersonii.AAC.1
MGTQCATQCPAASSHEVLPPTPDPTCGFLKWQKYLWEGRGDSSDKQPIPFCSSWRGARVNTREARSAGTRSFR